MLKVLESPGVLEIQSPMPVGQRILFLLLALVPLLAPYELIVRPDWQDYLSPTFLFAALVSAGALAVSVLLAWAAIAGLSSRLRFARADGTCTYSAGAPVVRWRTVSCPIDAIARLEVEVHDWSDGSPSYSFVAVMRDGRSYKSGSSWSRAEIEDIVRRAAAFLGLETRSGG